MANYVGGSVVWNLDIDKQKLVSGLKEAGDKVDKFSKDVKGKIGKSFKNAEQSSKDFAKAMAPIGALGVAGFGLAINEARKFETQMANVSTLISGDSTEAVGDLQAGILEMSKTMPKSIDELGGSVYDILSAGVEGSANQLGVLEASAKLATAGLGDTAGSTDLMTSAINAFNLPAEDAENIADVLFKTVKFGKTTVDQMAQSFGASAPVIASAGVTLEDFSAATAALTTTGMPASQAQNSLRAAIVSMTKPTTEMSSLFNEIGYTGLPQMIDEGLTMGQIFQLLDEAAGGNAETLTKAYGSVEAYTAALGVGQGVNESYRATLESMENGSNAVEEAFQKQRETVDSSMQEMQNSLSAVGIELGERFLPLIAEFAGWFADNLGPAIDGVTKFMQENWGLILILGGAIAGPLVYALGLWAVAAGIAAFNMLLLNLPLILIGVAVGALAAVIISNWDTIKSVFQTGVDFITGLVEGLWNFFSGIINSIGSTIDRIMPGDQSNLSSAPSGGGGAGGGGGSYERSYGRSVNITNNNTITKTSDVDALSRAISFQANL